LRHGKRAHQVHIDNIAEMVLRFLQGWDYGAHSGVIDQDVKPSEFGVRSIRQSLAVSWASDICLDGDCSPAGAFDQRNRLGQLRFPAGPKRDVRPGFRKRQCERPTQT
jgi:hypothetical protein